MSRFEPYVPEPFTPAEEKLIALSDEMLVLANGADVAIKTLVEAAYDAWDQANPNEPPIREVLARLAQTGREARERCNLLNSEASGSRLERERSKQGSFAARRRRRRSARPTISRREDGVTILDYGQETP